MTAEQCDHQVLAIAVDGLDVANVFVNEVAANNVSVIACGAIPALFRARNVKVRGCTQSCAQSVPYIYLLEYYRDCVCF